MNTMNRALNAYADVDLQTAVTTASPVQLIVLLYDGALAALASAKGRMQEMKLAEKGALISKAIGIVEGLRSVLDHEKGGDIARNLNDLYDYMKRRMATANLKNDPAMLDEVMGLLASLREAWVTLAAQERQQAAPARLTEPASGVSLRA